MIESNTSFYYPMAKETIINGEPFFFPVQKLTGTAQIPTKGSAEAAGFDLYADNHDIVVIEPHTTVMIGTGIAAAVPSGYVGLLFARSGLATKRALRPANCVGVIDADYRGEIKVALHNDSDEVRFIEPHERIAQLSLIPYLVIECKEVPALDITERGSGGFGSTGRV